jgi:hypothetical protein
MRRVVLLALVALAACTKRNPEVCCESRADCAELGVDEPKLECADGFSCVDHTCTAPQCEIDGDCGADTPFCSPDQICVGCVTSDQCSADAPICDPATRSCRGCTMDADCASMLCDTEAGSCVAENLIVYASPNGSESSGCELSAPCSITRALSIANVTRNQIKMLPGTYTASLVINAKQVTFHGAGATLTASGSDTIVVRDDGHLTIHGLTVTNTVGPPNTNTFGFRCESTNGIKVPSLALHDVTVDAQNVPMVIYRCLASISRSTIFTNAQTMGGEGPVTLLVNGGGRVTVDRSLIKNGNAVTVLDGGELQITNSVIADVNGMAGLVGEGVVAFGGSLRISYSTIINSRVHCMNALPCAQTGGSCLDNTIVSIMSSPIPTDSVVGCEASYTLVQPQSTQLVGSNNQFGISPYFRNTAQGDFRLGPSSPAIDAADPVKTGTPDFDGVARPQGARSDLGAFEFAP